MRALRLALIQVRYVNRAFWRNPAAAVFTFGFPLIFLFIFSEVLGNSRVRLGAVTVASSTYYVAAMSAFAVVTACYTNLAITVSSQREMGILKKLRATPLPAGSYIAARMIHAVAVAIGLVLVTAALGTAFFGAKFPTGPALGGFLACLVVGAASFAALGLALSAAVPSVESSSAVVNATALPLLFLSGVFVPLGSNSPAWLRLVAKILPVWHFARGMEAGYVGIAFHWSDIGAIAAWGALGALVAARYFRWEPRR